MTDDIENKLHQLTQILVDELISITPESMSEIQFELVATDDGGADIGLLENHPEVPHVALSTKIYEVAPVYILYVKQYVKNWSRSLIIITESSGSWVVNVEFENT